MELCTVLLHRLRYLLSALVSQPGQELVQQEEVQEEEQGQANLLQAQVRCSISCLHTC